MSDDERLLAWEHCFLISRYGAQSDQARAAEKILNDSGRKISLPEAVRLMKILSDPASGRAPVADGIG